MFAFDHLVHLTRDPLQAAHSMRQAGFHAVEGGRHDSWGTYNALCYFGLSYIEFLGIENRHTAKKAQQNPLVKQAVASLPETEGLARLAIRTGRIEQLADELRAKGLTVHGPLPGRRTRADGTVIRWSLLFPEVDPNELQPPFFIQWEQSNDARRADLLQGGFIADHFSGTLRLKRVAFAVRDLKRRVAEWVDWFGLETGGRFMDNRLLGECQELLLPGGNILFCSPVGTGELTDVLNTRGETPFRVDIIGSTIDREQRICGALYRLLK